MNVNNMNIMLKGVACAVLLGIGLSPSLLVAASPNAEDIRQGQELGRRLQDASQFIAGADVPALKQRFSELIGTLPKTEWGSVYGAVSSEPNALRAAWFSSALMYPVDSGLAASDADAYVAYMVAKEIFAVLLDKEPVMALGILASFSSEQPTVLQAMLCGVVVQTKRTPSKAAALNQRLQEVQALDAWKKLLKSENPIVQSLALEMVPAGLASSPSLTDAIRSTLTNKWVSLQAIAIEAVGKHRPPGADVVLDDYLHMLQSSDMPPAMKDVLRAKVIESKASLAQSISNGQ